MTIDLLPALGRAALYLGVPFIFLIFYLQWKWAKDCNNFIRVLVAQRAGGGAWAMAPKGSDTITITSGVDKTTREWPINELATIDVLYPGVGFIPSFMQKTIRLAIVNEGDMEPVLNRSPHRERIASPDVIGFMESVAARSDDPIKTEIIALVKTLATGPTRELVADPAILGALRKSSALKALATMGDDLLDTLKTINAKLTRIMGPHPTVVYIGLGLIAILVVYLVFKIHTMELGDLSNLTKDIALIKQSLGVK